MKNLIAIKELKLLISLTHEKRVDDATEHVAHHKLHLKYAEMKLKALVEQYKRITVVISELENDAISITTASERISKILF